MRGGLQFVVVLATVAMTVALPRSPDHTPREQQVFEYFPDYRYVDPMENPQFMTVKCTSEGVFPHPYNCTWFYRCHDRTGHGIFTTNWFYCEPGTEFDDDLDQCIPKSGTCGGGDDQYFCRTLASSCRTCSVGASTQQLCEFKECFNGGRDAGIQPYCDQGKLFDGQNCVEVSSCPPVLSSPPGECPLNKMRPAAKWTDQSSGCTLFNGCRAGRNYQETLCTSFYDCHQGFKVERACPEGYFFSEQWNLCIQPPQNDCSAPPPPPAPQSCSMSQGVGQDCQDMTGCFNGDQQRTTRRLCDHYTCPQTGSEVFRCVHHYFNPDTKTCENPGVCPDEECLPEDAVRWESCDFYTGYRYPSAEKISLEQLCQLYSCSQTNGLRPCGPGQLFAPQSRTCLSELTPIPIPPPPTCTPELATHWEGCVNNSFGCPIGGIDNIREECQMFKCSADGVASSCPLGQMFIPSSRSCSILRTRLTCPPQPPLPPTAVTPLPCTVDRAQFWGDCKDVKGCSADNQAERTENQCQTFKCSVSGEDLRCDGGKVFSPNQRACVESLSESSCPCTVDRAQFWGDCKDVKGCSSDNQSERTENQCQTFQCSITGQEQKCEGGLVFSPDQRACVESLSESSCPCTVERAQFWGDCKDVKGCSTDNQSERTENQCQTYQCSITGQEFRCEGGKVFSPDQRACVESLSESSCPCTVDRAQFWGDCKDVKGCSADNQLERTENQCQTFQCSITGQEMRCQGVKVFSPTLRACVEPLSESSCPCTAERAKFWGDCKDVKGCSADNLSERMENQCQTYQCSITGQEFRCEGGKVFSPDQRTCVEPLSDVSCPCTIDRAQGGINCTTVTGCTLDNTEEQTEEQCSSFVCSNTGSPVSCEEGLVYSSAQRSCVTPLDPSACLDIIDVCTPNLAKKWTSCQDRCNEDGSKTEMCYHFTCTESLNDKVPCIDDGQFTEMFDPTTKTCKSKRNDCPRSASSAIREGCSAGIAQFWFDCSINAACIADRYPLQQQTLCRQYSCDSEKISCSAGLLYDSKKSACVKPLSGKYCQASVPQQQPKVTLKSWNSQWN